MAPRELVAPRASAAVLTMKGDGTTKWSYVSVNVTGEIMRVAEKEPISDRATCGLYWWRHGAEFVRCVEAMIEDDDRTNNEFYVAPAMKYCIMGGRGRVFEVAIENCGNVFHGLGTPEDLKAYLETMSS